MQHLARTLLGWGPVAAGTGSADVDATFFKESPGRGRTWDLFVFVYLVLSFVSVIIPPINSKVC